MKPQEVTKKIGKFSSQLEELRFKFTDTEKSLDLKAKLDYILEKEITRKKWCIYK